jgi:hypothetical protein
MIILKATAETLQVTTSSAAGLDYSVAYNDVTTTTFSPSSNEGKISSATTTSILAAPAASTQRQVKLIIISNRDASVSDTIVIQKNISSTLYNLTPSITLLAGETLQYMDSVGWTYYSATGVIKTAGTVAGSTTQIQFNNAGILSGDADFTWNWSTNTLALGTSSQIALKGVSSQPSVPAASTLTLYGQALAGKMQLMKMGSDGFQDLTQSAVWQNNIVSWTPGVAAGVWQGALGTNMGTTAAVISTPTTAYTAMRRTTFATVATTANQQVGVRSELQFLRGASSNMGGFLFICRFGFETWTATNRLFVGFSSSNTSLAAVNPTTVADTIGFAINTADSAISFIHTNASVSLSKDAISGQPALATGNAYVAYIYCKPNDTTVYYRLDNVLTGTTIVDSSATTPLPTNTALLYAHAEIGNGPTNTAVGAATLGVNLIYIETLR